ncbi:peroxin-5 [Fistulifera solaris]|uniref:Peroxin-5 n=1 Tax=Fistulifera solaris TaxID=1519565 RepID=A0A1Z5KII9_FISSO|nr:peroxin-5 [Fistulifera solaris]|eukprot:GAX26123.1 peroxin-5 [Fistulifera solaris]
MADCSAVGTAIDQTARALVSADAAKQASSLLGHWGHVNSAAPLTTPQHLVLPGAVTAASTASVTAVATAPVQQDALTQQLNSQSFLQHPQQHQQTIHLQIAQQQQQQQMMQMQQQVIQYNLQLQQRQQQLQQQQNQQNQTKDAFESWHDGLDIPEQWRQEFEEHENLGHEGIVNPVSIEELASAWQEAQAEWDDTTPEVANLWTGQSADEHTSVYEFIHKHQLQQDAPPTLPQDWMEQGMLAFQQGDLPTAIHAFEMELQQNNPDHATAWRMLGACHAENDMDALAIQCLEQAVERDPYSSSALLALGVSYVNELQHEKALEHLKAWITHNPIFAGMEIPDDDVYGPAEGDVDSSGSFETVQRLLLEALRFVPEASSEVLEALGVVYNVSRDYDAAIDSFRRAVAARPGDYQLWNKLGATLANSNRSEEALPAYHKALQLKPKYARAWLNMAISHSNLQNYEEAARCYLQTLSLNPDAMHCWSYLRISLSQMERWDLIPLVAQQDLPAFQEHFDFFLYDNAVAHGS